MNSRPITQKDYELLLSLDKKVYPTDSPVTSEILDNWSKKNPEFGIVFEEDEKTKGLCIVIPLNKKGWEKLTKGELLESGLDAETIFDINRDKEIGLHTYHIENLGERKGIWKDSLKAINSILESLRKKSELKVIGFSGLCVTSQGIGLFYNKFNCREREFLNSEHILRKENSLEIFDTKDKQELLDKLSKDYEYVNRCKMLLVYPDEASLVWNYLN